MRWLGAILVFLACTGFGLAFAQEQKMRLKWVQNLRKAVILLRGQILYANAAISEALRESGNRMEGELGEFLLRVSERVEEGEGESLREIWTEEIQKEKDNWPMEKQELEDFLQFGKELGYLDLAMQEKTLNLYMEKLELSEGNLLKTLDAKVRMSASLGVLGGVFLVIVLI